MAVFVRSQDGKIAGTSDPADPSMYFLPSVDQYHNEYYLPRFKDADEKDYQMVSGITGDVEPGDKISELLRARLPWLLIGLLGGMILMDDPRRNGLAQDSKGCFVLKQRNLQPKWICG